VNTLREIGKLRSAPAIEPELLFPIGPAVIDPRRRMFCRRWFGGQFAKGSPHFRANGKMGNSGMDRPPTIVAPNDEIF
jgi:hypothetical protein